jgi:hypothetical protein
MVERLRRLKDIEAEHGIPFSAFKLTNDSRGIKGDYEHLEVDAEYSIVVFGKAGRSYKALAWGHDAPIVVLDTKSYGRANSYNWSEMLQCRLELAAGIDMDTVVESKEWADASLRHEYIATHAYYMWEMDCRYGFDAWTADLDRWLEAEEYINARYVFIEKRRLEVYG